MSGLKRLQTSPEAHLELASEAGEENELVACRAGRRGRVLRSVAAFRGSRRALPAQKGEQAPATRSSHLGAALKAELGQKEVCDV